MQKTVEKIEYTVCSEMQNKKVTAIIVCGGSSERMNGIDKLKYQLCGTDVFIHSVMAFQNNNSINNIIIVTKEENINYYQNKIIENEITKVSDIIAGGKCREESSFNAVRRLDDDTEIVLIHDGARPLVTDKCINNAVAGASEYGACACAVSVNDTIKKVNEDKMVINTPDRSTLVSVQTPQAFKKDIIINAFEKFKNCLSIFTDDCSLVEKSGNNVYIVEGDMQNIKITNRSDLAVAELFTKGKC